MKKLLSIITMCMLLCNGQAVAQQLSYQAVAPQGPAGFKPFVPAADFITPQGNQLWWGYFTGEGELGAIGVSAAATYNCAIFIPGNQFNAGTKIHAFSFYLRGKSSVLTDVSVWMSRQLPATADRADVAYKPVSRDDLIVATQGPNHVAFDTPYEITSAGVYVGYSLTILDAVQSDERAPIMTTGQHVTTPNAMFLSLGSSVLDWADYSQSPYSDNRLGNLAVQVLISSDFGTDAAGIRPLADAVGVYQDQTVNYLPVELTNYGSRGITDIDYTVTSASSATSELFHYDLPASVAGIAQIGTQIGVNLPVPANAAATGSDEATIVVTKVNGADNQITPSTATATATLFTLKTKPTRRVLEEEFTGTWCGWCPRGTVGMARLAQLHPDNYIGIAVHKQDIMEISDYAGVDTPTGGYPGCSIDRVIGGDPYFGTGIEPLGIENAFAEALSRFTVADLSVSAAWNDDQTAIAVTAATTFQYDSPTAPYALGYVAVHDALSGSGSSWLQENYFYMSIAADYRDYDELFLPFVDGGSRVLVDYDHVAVKALGINRGLSNSVKAPLVAGATQTHTATLNMANAVSVRGERLVQDPARMHVVAVLLNTQTGEVVNAAECAISAPLADAVVTPDAAAQAEVTARYNVAGQRVGASAKGLTLLRLSDGRTVKVMGR